MLLLNVSSSLVHSLTLIEASIDLIRSKLVNIFKTVRFVGQSKEKYFYDISRVSVLQWPNVTTNENAYGIHSSNTRTKKKQRQSSQPFAWQHFDLYDSVKSQLTSALVKVLNRIGNEVFPTKWRIKNTVKNQSILYWNNWMSLLLYSCTGMLQLIQLSCL